MRVGFGVAEAIRWTGARQLAGEAEAGFAGVGIDSRSLEAGELFVAIVGPRHDGHDHLGAAASRGAAGLLVAAGRPLPQDLPAGLPVLAADDTTRALGALAAGHRRGFAGPLVAITGSNGKTTTKEMCAAILEEGAPTLRNRGNLNNQYGLPLTLLAREGADRRAVVELGMNHRGEIAGLAAIAAPTVGVVTNVGSAHIEHLGSRDAIAAEKGDLLAALAGDATAVLPAEDDYAEALAGRTRARVVRFGRKRGEVRAEQIRELPGRGFAFALRAAEGDARVEMPGLAPTTVDNALAAAAAALAAGAAPAELERGLARYRPPTGRLERRDLPNGAVLLDDTYNANPQSTAVALRCLARAPEARRRVAVLGEMGELGVESERAHREAGALAAELGLDLLVGVGAHASAIAEGARAAGMRGDVSTFPSSKEAAAPLREWIREGDWVLVKGSRSAQMERVARALAGEE